MSNGEMQDKVFERIGQLTNGLRGEQTKDIFEVPGMQDKLSKMLSMMEERVKSLEAQSINNTALAMSAFLLGFQAVAADSANSRKLKDTWIRYLKKVGLSTEVTNLLEERMIAICEAGEQP